MRITQNDFFHRQFEKNIFNERKRVFLTTEETPEQKLVREREDTVEGINTTDKLSNLVNTSHDIIKRESQKSRVGGFMKSPWDKQTHGKWRERTAVGRTRDTINQKIHQIEGRRWGIKEKAAALAEEKITGILGSEHMRDKLIAIQEQLALYQKERELKVGTLNAVHGMEVSTPVNHELGIPTEFDVKREAGEDISKRGKERAKRIAKPWQLLSQAGYLYADYTTWRGEHPILWGEVETGRRLLIKEVKVMDKIIIKLARTERRIRGKFEKHHSVKTREEWIAENMARLNAEPPKVLTEEAAGEILDEVTASGVKNSDKFKKFEQMMRDKGLESDIRSCRINAEEITRGTKEGRWLRKMLKIPETGSMAKDYEEVQRRERQRKKGYESLDTGDKITRELHGKLGNEIRVGSTMAFDFNWLYAQEFQKSVSGDSTVSPPVAGSSMYELQRMKVVNFDDHQIQLSSAQDGTADVIIDLERKVLIYKKKELTLGVLNKTPRIINPAKSQEVQKAGNLEIANKIREKIYEKEITQEALLQNPGVRIKFKFGPKNRDKIKKRLGKAILDGDKMKLLQYSPNSIVVQQPGSKDNITIDLRNGTMKKAKRKTIHLGYLDPDIETSFEIIRS